MSKQPPKRLLVDGRVGGIFSGSVCTGVLAGILWPKSRLQRAQMGGGLGVRYRAVLSSLWNWQRSTAAFLRLMVPREHRLEHVAPTLAEEGWEHSAQLPLCAQL